MKSFFKENKLLCIGVLGILLFSLIASLIQNGFGKVKVSTYNNQTMTQIADTIRDNVAGCNKDVEVTFDESTTYKMTYKILQPKTATKETPAPAVVVMHGGLSNKDTYAPIYIELARRGFVVIAFDAMGHGKTDMQVDELTHNTMGMEAIVELAMSLPFVDENNVAVTGHSWGNNGSVNVVNAINLDTNNPRIRALLVAQGSLAYLDLREGAIDDMLFGFSVGKYDEMDTLYWGSYNLPEGEWANSWLAEIYPDYSETIAPLGVWYTEEGAVDLKEGDKIDASEARVLYNPANTHPAALFSTTATAVNINFFYGAFGTPVGAKYIASNSQVWPVFIFFVFLALMSWFLIAFGLIALLLRTYSFKCLANGKERLESLDKNLPSFKDLRQSVPTLIMYIGLVVFCTLTIGKLPLTGARLIPTSQFFPCAAHTASAYGFWSAIVALVATAALIVIMYIKRIMYKKEGGPEAVPNPFKVAKVPAGEAFYAIFMGLLMVAIMFAILFVIEGLFNVNFVIATNDYTTIRMNKIPILFRYVWFFVPFYFVNAVMCANTRFKDIPEWATTAFVCVGNLLGIVIWLAIQYTALINKGALIATDAVNVATTVWAQLLPMAMSPIIVRYTYKKTGTIWLGVTFNAFLFTLSLVGTGQYMTYPLTLLGL